MRRIGPVVRMLACHAGDPGSILGRDKAFQSALLLGTPPHKAGGTNEWAVGHR